ncbi:centrosomal protein of 19 kDa-like [Patiria miniata]|uniref:Centrosomal protein of 19 kDa n=1 Tax=Patiria miniata TaxID=46514 RepID=A0A913ZED2_PATMI|nr:centrosomal protein of 19 kDa-like [Patiria miniata]XP_038050147.1 centrosomal protein of 19 kDa-like [Patiria miniata]XP_038050148.1 centrosomal protein of 19 kDa-like [Patiria miniata]
MSITPKKCAIRVDPPTLVLTYTDEVTGKDRQRSMPLRNFTKRSGVDRFVRELKANPRHKKYLENVSAIQLEKLLSIIKERLSGLSMEESLEKVKKELSVDPDEDLNQLDDQALQKKKSIMDETFEKNRKKPGEEGFQYDVDVDFGGGIESSGWDSGEESDPQF